MFVGTDTLSDVLASSSVFFLIFTSMSTKMKECVVSFCRIVQSCDGDGSELKMANTVGVSALF